MASRVRLAFASRSTSREAIRRRDRCAELLADIGRNYGVSGATISRLTL